MFIDGNPAQAVFSFVYFSCLLEFRQDAVSFFLLYKIGGIDDKKKKDRLRGLLNFLHGSFSPYALGYRPVALPSVLRVHQVSIHSCETKTPHPLRRRLVRHLSQLRDEHLVAGLHGDRRRYAAGLLHP